MYRNRMDNISQPLQQNAHDLEQELQWLTKLIDVRFKRYFNQQSQDQTDEANTLFGKRSETNHSNDCYANRELSFLLL